MPIHLTDQFSEIEEWNNQEEACLRWHYAQDKSQEGYLETQSQFEQQYNRLLEEGTTIPEQVKIAYDALKAQPN